MVLWRFVYCTTYCLGRCSSEVCTSKWCTSALSFSFFKLKFLSLAGGGGGGGTARGFHFLWRQSDVDRVQCVHPSVTTITRPGFLRPERTKRDILMISIQFGVNRITCTLLLKKMLPGFEHIHPKINPKWQQ